MSKTDRRKSVSQPPLTALRVFEAVARTGGFSRAADELCLTQSGVSRHVRGLEEWFGSPLFGRSGNRPTLLPHAATLAESLGGALREIEAACRRARRAGGPPALTVAAVPSVAICWLIPRLGGFRALMPDVTVRIVYAIHGQPVDFGDVDLAVVFAEDPGPGARPFLPGLTVPVCAPHLGRPTTPAEIVRTGLLHDTDARGWLEWLDAAGASEVAAATVAAGGPVFEDFNLLRAAVLSGQGVALCPLAIVAEDLNAGRLAQLSPIAIRAGFGYHVVVADGLDPRRAEAVATFADWLLSTAVWSVDVP
jgi:DNA-binding transcriptional LysR family regulator